MALVPIESLRRQVLQILDKTDPPGGVELLSYKRDRGITLIRLESGMIRLIERGFEQQEFVAERSGLPRLLKTLFKREFPRSRKVRLLKFASLEDVKIFRQGV